jgi:hypothetical protein
MIQAMRLEIGDAYLDEGTAVYIDCGIAWSGKLSLTDELLLTRNGKAVIAGIKAYAQLFRIKDIHGLDFSVHIGDIKSRTDLITYLEEKHGRTVFEDEIVTVVTLSPSRDQARITNETIDAS